MRLWPVLRFIPAGAGNTCRVVSGSRSKSVHPRGRGEHEARQGGGEETGGSSPRARGTRTAGYESIRGTRFIPAGAGNTSRRRSTPQGRTVHPRGRGEHSRSRANSGEPNGSSPRARGTLTASPSSQVRDRFIPAGAGNTLRHVRRYVGVAVHPRGRGEHNSHLIVRSIADGSSPRARGTPGPRQRAPGLRRFIPAGAGNTPARPARSDSAPVHPRGRGEHSSGTRATPRTTGSSPRARGTRYSQSRAGSSGRFIPAGAGNTSALWR